ncbi:MAG: T9SS type A sorting domain-containing protein [bacterium]|nr:MAG: T9SS type A sorting domain-containing protein [bacterium]
MKFESRKNLKLSSLTIALFFTVIGTVQFNLYANAIDAEELQPAVCILTDHSLGTLEKVRDVLMKNGARALHIFPPDVIFGEFPHHLDELDLKNFNAEIVQSQSELPSGDINPIILHTIKNLFQKKKLLINSERPNTPSTRNQTYGVQPRILSNLKRMDPNVRLRSEIVDRKIDQNSEFMIGTVLINIIFPESVGEVENWTDDEITGVINGFSPWLNSLQGQIHWVDLNFIYNYIDNIRIPVSYEPVLCHIDNDHLWISEALEYLGYANTNGHLYQAHSLNNDTRLKYGADWVFTAFVVDVSQESCWLYHDDVAYSYLGGPFMVIPYPACEYGYGLGFGRVFIREMCHIFWATYEYLSPELSCNECSGYLAVVNPNAYSWSRKIPCDPPHIPCIMDSDHYSGGPSICRHTLGQMGMIDENRNSLPDIYEVYPTVEFVDIPDVLSDTIFDDSYAVLLRAMNEAVPNRNPRQSPILRIDYAPKLASGDYQINSGPLSDLTPSDKKWDQTEEHISFFVSGFIPGKNTLRCRVENQIGLKTEIEKEIYYVGLVYDWITTSAEAEQITVGWTTAGETFDAVFDVMHQDMTAGSGEKKIGTVTEPDESGINRNYYSYIDESILAGHEYRYWVIGKFDYAVNDTTIIHYEVASESKSNRAVIPVGSDVLSPLLPNPMQDQTVFTVKVPESYHDPTGSQRLSHQSPRLATQGLVEVKTQVDVSVYDVNGRLIALLYSRKRYGGLMTLTWDGLNSFGQPVASGVYFIKVSTGGIDNVKKIVVIR